MKNIAILLLLACSEAWGAPPEIDVPANVPEHTLVRCKLNDPTALSVTWLVFPEVADVDEDENGEMQFAGPPREYSIIAVVIREGNKLGQVRGKTTIGKVAPPPVVVDPDKPPPVVVDPTVKADKATYVYEKDSGGVPPAVMAGLNKLNREKKILATVLEDDPQNGTGSVPEQYKLAHAEARKAGVPALVVESAGKLLRVVKAPTTTEQVLEAAQ